MRIYKRALLPATIFFILVCLISAFLPLSGANWNEVLTISVDIVSVETPLPETPQSQAGTTLSAMKTATGFAEERDGVPVFGVRGIICVANYGERPTEGLFILDTIQFKSGSGKYQDYLRVSVDVFDMQVLEPGQEFCYPYEIAFPPVQAKKVNYRNTADVTIHNHSGWLPGGNNCEGPDACPFGPNVKADFNLP